jgi:hypothetical protein
MRQADHRLHFNCVHLIERMIKNTRGVNDLKSEIFVVQMTNK